jgi:hypothetical protein
VLGGRIDEPILHVNDNNCVGHEWLG